MPNWTQVEGDITQWMRGFAREGLDFRGPRQCIPGFPPDAFRGDGVLTDGRTLLAVEIEAGQMHPDTNVAKYWLLASHKCYEKTILVHVYTPRYNSYNWRKNLAEFLVEKMRHELVLEYCLLDLRKATDYDAVVSEVRRLVELKIQQAFTLQSVAAR